ncbi:MAG: UbiA family prenyltransferase [Clostridiales bacterium]|nr:UbiA family prenyltransferase [Clostridiales bacterium]HOB36329.1 UbiA family prenyltransferase [Candidatus Avimonas sp.]
MVKRFLSFIEIKTKITSVFAFLMTAAYLYYIGQKIDLVKTAVFFASMFLFDLTTTAINNYVDTKTNNQVLQFKRRAALTVILVMFAAAASFGVYLALITDVVVLLLGGLCFLCGVFYSFGPVSISRLPLGEVMSGLFYGFFIPFILLYINMPRGTYLLYSATGGEVSLTFKVLPIITVILLSAAPFCATANIMLANNICDVERDAAVKRHTLPYYIGGKALYLFAGLYYLAYISVVLMVALDMLPQICILILVTLVPVQRNINIFLKKQDKSTTFITAVMNYVIIMAADCLLIAAGGLLKRL